MNKNQRVVAITAIAAILMIVAGVLISRYYRYGGLAYCQGGSHPKMDASAFATQYTGYSMRIEGKLRDDKSFLVDFGESQLQEMSDNIQGTRLHMQALAEGYNGCAVSPEQYNQSQNDFETLNSVAGRIDALVSKQVRSSGDSAELKKLVSEYIRVSRTLSQR